MHLPYTVMLIVPTGIGASIGGYAGDALPVARAVSQVCDRLITHPNVMNGAQLYWNLPNVFYTEGYALDQFAAGNWNLRPVHDVGMGNQPIAHLRHRPSNRQRISRIAPDRGPDSGRDDEHDGVGKMHGDLRMVN